MTKKREPVDVLHSGRFRNTLKQLKTRFLYKTRMAQLDNAYDF